MQSIIGKRCAASLLALAFCLGASGISRAQEPQCTGVASDNAYDLYINSANGIYAAGEKVSFSINVNESLTDSLRIVFWANNRVFKDYKAVLPEGRNVLYEHQADTTVAIYCEVFYKDYVDRMGAVVAPEGFRAGYSLTSEVKRYWKKFRKQVREFKGEQSCTFMHETPKGIDTYDVTIECPEVLPVRGYMSKPKDAKEKSLPIVIEFKAAGVAGNWCMAKTQTSERFAGMGNGCIAFNLNAHGIPNDMPQAYYDSLEVTALRHYNTRGIHSRDSIYFRGMYIRMIKALDFLCQQPEWDGKRILVMGESQGGGQSCVAAGLDPRVTHIDVIVPAMLDWGAEHLGRRSGWPQPIPENNRKKHPVSLSDLDYVLSCYDAAVLLSMSKANIFCEVGLVDITCPPSSVFSALNGAGSNTRGKLDADRIRVIPVPYRGHSWPSGKYRPGWDKDTYPLRTDYLLEFLNCK